MTPEAISQSKFDRESLVKMCTLLHYSVGLSQVDISRKLRINKTSICRYLKEARERDFVSIQVNLPPEEEVRTVLFSEYDLLDEVVGTSWAAA
jgi:DNA-binding transcriptional regulator LsrR (DeoR family)